MSHSRSRVVLRTALGALFLGAGALQATHRDTFTALVPKQFSKNAALFQGIATGVLAGIGVAFLVPRLRLVARWAATLMLAGTLPAAVDQVRHPEQTAALGLPARLVVLRIPAQLLVIFGTWLATAKPQPTPKP